MIEAKKDDFCPNPSQTYLFIGNGFDIECGLPTRYRDFLEFLQDIDCIIANGNRLDDQNLISKVQDQIIERYSDKTRISELEAWKPVVNSFWRKHFISCSIGLDWIDFETEISRVIKAVEASMNTTFYHRQTSFEDKVVDRNPHEVGEFIDQLFPSGTIKRKEDLETHYLRYEISYRQLRDRMLQDLNTFTLGFEKYLIEYVETLPVHRTDSIDELIGYVKHTGRLHIVSFNYTTTLEKILSEENVPMDICYIHGRVGDKDCEGELVLGIDEHLVDNEEIRRNLGFAPFRKYNQRIYKQTSSAYYDWLKPKGSYPKNFSRALYIFGHSLGVSDRDVLRMFLSDKLMKSIIYYYNEDAFSNQISNITAILDKDNVVMRTGGEEPDILFRRQKLKEM